MANAIVKIVRPVAVLACAVLALRSIVSSYIVFDLERFFPLAVEMWQNDPRSFYASARWEALLDLLTGCILLLASYRFHVRTRKF